MRPQGKRKSILIISKAFYPVKSPRSYRATELVKEFARMGHEVTLLTLKQDNYHIQFEEEHGVKIKGLGPLRLPEIKLTGGNKIIGLIKKLLKRGLGLFFEYPDIELMVRVRNSLRTEEGYDLLISIAVPHTIHWGVAWARSEHHSIAETWAADCGDPYMGFDRDRFSKPFYFKYFEKMFCRKADYITVPLEGAKEAYYAEFRDKIEVIPQGFKFEKVEIDRGTINKNGIPKFGFAGNLLGGGRNPHELMEYLVNLDRHFKFIIYTQNTTPLLPYLEKGGDRIEIRDYVPRDRLLKELSRLHFLVNLENDTSTQLPSKLIDYYQTGRPVLSVPSSGLEPETVNQFLEGNYSERYRFNNMDRYQIENVCRQFLELCKPD